MYELLLWLHLLLFVYWLGADLAVFYSSQFVVDSKLSAEARITAAKVMLACDLAPRICMSLTLTIGGLLASAIGVQHSSWQLALIVVLAPIWMSMVLILHFRNHASYIPTLIKIDWWFRCALILAITISCALSIAQFTPGHTQDSWLLSKLLIFAFLIFCGLMIRHKLSGFNLAYAKLITGDITSAENHAMEISLQQVKPWVLTIWFGLVLAAYLGIAKPLLWQA